MNRNNYFMCRPKRHFGRFLVRFYSRDPWPWYQASIVVSKSSEAYPHFDEFIRDCEAHRENEND